VQWISWSVAKSFVSALVGIAVVAGPHPLDRRPDQRLRPGRAGSAYDGVSIKDVLQMSSGARWHEDYSDRTSDVARLGAAMAPGGSLDRFVATAVPESPAGTVCQYNSTDTQALGTLLVRATGRSITDYMQEHLYEPLGMESDGYWLLDATGREMAFGGVNLTARDFAKLGELYRLRRRVERAPGGAGRLGGGIDRARRAASGVGPPGDRRRGVARRLRLPVVAHPRWPRPVQRDRRVQPVGVRVAPATTSRS
jgi:CubicO group peptidase (beta-lactamase class C family)